MSQLDTNPASGTRDFLPDEVARRQAAFDAIRASFELHGFAPMETPAFERLDVLLGKYGEEGDQLIFKILRRGEHEETGETDLALRYDLTVPMARFVAKYGGELGEPFKRYCIAPVWRADRPGRGRFREFFQCDVDTIGSDSLLADAEVLQAVTSTLDGLGLGGFEVQLNARDVLYGLIAAYGVPEELADGTLVAVDKLAKIGVDGVAAELRERGVPGDAVDGLAEDLGADDLTDRVRERLAGHERGEAGLAQVDRVLELLGGEIPGGSIGFHPQLARGLSYYTGPIFEIVHPSFGSTIASGGRYDGLVGMFTNREIPATGGSIGIERVLLLLEDRLSATSSADVLVTFFDADGEADALALATRLRGEGLRTDLAVGGGRLGKQLKYADRRGARFALIRGSDERAAGTVAVKDLASGEQTPVALDDLVGHLRRGLA